VDPRLGHQDIVKLGMEMTVGLLSLIVDLIEVFGRTVFKLGEQAVGRRMESDLPLSKTL
jgi:hypothetical protein